MASDREFGTEPAMPTNALILGAPSHFGGQADRAFAGTGWRIESYRQLLPSFAMTPLEGVLARFPAIPWS